MTSTYRVIEVEEYQHASIFMCLCILATEYAAKYFTVTLQRIYINIYTYIYIDIIYI